MRLLDIFVGKPNETTQRAYLADAGLLYQTGLERAKGNLVVEKPLCPGGESWYFHLPCAAPETCCPLWQVLG